MKLFIIGIIVYLGCIIHWQINKVPTVYWSNTKNKCVKVLLSGQECDCSSINFKTDKYEKVWVK